MKNKARRIMDLLNAAPNRTNPQIAREVGCHETYVSKLRSKMAHVPACTETYDEAAEITQAPVGLTGVDAILTERGSRYGKFTEHARITQNLKRAMEDSPNWNYLADDTRETLEMIAHKMGRILNGDPEYADNFIDIAGYAKLVADRLEGRVR